MSAASRDATITFRLPQELREKVEERAADHSSGTVSGYLVELIERDTGMGVWQTLAKMERHLRRLAKALELELE